LPFELAFTLDRVKTEAPEHPEWKDQQPYNAILEGDLPGLVSQGRAGLEAVLITTHPGMTADEFQQNVGEWLATAKHPRFNRPYTDVAY